MTIDADLRSRIAGVLQEGPALHLAVLFGSAARGEQRPGSDIDVGIVPVDPGLRLRDELDLQVRLEHACRSRVDLVRLDRASTLLKWTVANDGQPLVSEPSFAWARFVAASAVEYAELAPQLRDAEERFRARLAAAGAR